MYVHITVDGWYLDHQEIGLHLTRSWYKFQPFPSRLRKDSSVMVSGLEPMPWVRVTNTGEQR